MEEGRESAAQESSGHQLAAIGAALRIARNGVCSVEQLAVKSGVSAGSISMIERGQGNPSLSTLVKIAHALDIPLDSLFLAAREQKQGLVRAGEGMRLMLPGGEKLRLTYEVLNPTLQGKLALVRTEIPPGASSGEHPLSHPGEEVVHVLSGELTYWVSDEMFGLRPGDSLTYDSHLAHRWLNKSRAPVMLMSAMTPPLF